MNEQIPASLAIDAEGLIKRYSEDIIWSKGIYIQRPVGRQYIK